MTPLAAAIAGGAGGFLLARIVIALRRSRPRRPRPIAGRCELCERIAELKLTPYRDNCRWVCRGCYAALNDDGAGP